MRKLLESFDHLGKIAPQWLTALRLQQHFVVSTECQAAEPIPFRLVDPVVTCWNRVYRPRFHGRVWRPNWQVDAREFDLQLFGSDGSIRLNCRPLIPFTMRFCCGHRSG